MKASNRLRLIVTKEGRAPSFLAQPGRHDHLELVEIESGEVVLYWDLEPREASRAARAMREDLIRMEDDDFLAKWGADQAG
jgi:hypothetical protein